ncbi:glycoside hydrolase family 27 protein [Phanerochaete sordida]|uniref:Alpha-galactosidase n=1 Tax=Phanerochaete sordida TaxID=48140 RepID=A0A9P3GJG2_9APHY|nr:glycoside hydrolase family 27 protein [Phanerochaete sordida]
MLVTGCLLLASFVGGAYAQSQPWAQCGGAGWTGSTACTAGWVCTYQNDYYSQCLQASSSATSRSSSPSSVSTTSSRSSSTVSSTTSTHSSSSASSSSTATLTGIAGTAPTVGPSQDTGKLPALGWNAWNAYGCGISNDIIYAAASDIVSLGLQAAGYEYVNIDDCWAEMKRDPTTQQIIPDPTKFPNGISGLATQIHALGLKVGIYSDAGTATCAGFPGSLGYENIDAATFTEWGIDYLKYDNCNVPGNWSDTYPPPGNDYYNSNSAIRYRQMTAALAAQSRPVQFSLCIWGAANVWQWGSRVGHSWRMSGDSSASWSYITEILTTNAQYLDYVDFYSHNDMDMMEIGNGDLTIQEQRTHFAAWCFMKSPILLGTDLSKLNSTQLAIVTNPELLAFHQDATIGAPAKPFAPTANGTTTTNPPEFYAGTSTKGTHVFIINTASSTATMGFTFSLVPGLAAGSKYVVHDMWAGKDLGTFSGSYSASIAAHDTAAFLVTPA